MLAMLIAVMSQSLTRWETYQRGIHSTHKQETFYETRSKTLHRQRGDAHHYV